MSQALWVFLILGPMDNSPQKTILSGLAQRLVSNQLLKKEVALHIYHEALQNNVPFITQLLSKNILSAYDVARAIAQDFGLPLMDLSQINLDVSITKIVAHELIQKHHSVPIFIRGKSLFVALSDPTNFSVLDEFKFHCGLNTYAVIVEDNQLKKLLRHVAQNAQDSLSDLFDEELKHLGIDHIEENSDYINFAANDDFVIQYVNKIILNAINKKASDIHFEPYTNQYRIRYRVDGILYEIAQPPANLASRIAARLKVMARLNIAERRVPQDGHFKMAHMLHHSIELRICTCPMIAGEKIVLRILDPANTHIDIKELGFEAKQKIAFISAINKPQGMVLATGPTGSGKTVTLYTALNILNLPERNISTVEDPVEINMVGINQVSVNLKAGLNFSNALRAFLRQDPDIIMVGEIRDLETAEIAIKAAQTGHLVLSTLHTNSAAETLTRMMNMGVATYNLATSVNLIIAQRLARRLCHHCKKLTAIPKDALINFGFTEQEITDCELFEPVGCEHCTNGYAGRIGIYEILVVSDAIGRMLMRGGHAMDILQQAKKEGMQTLQQSGLNRIKEGITSLSEINRIIKD